MKIIHALCIVLLGLPFLQNAGIAQSRPDNTLLKPTALPRAYHTAWLDVNRVKLEFNNRGGLASRKWGGGFWPDTSVHLDNVIVFDMGPWVIGKIRDTVKMAFSQWGSSYSPGPVINGQPALFAAPADSERYRLYRITRGDGPGTNPDYAEWPAEWGGAPVDAQGNPRLYGDQTVWTVFNNLDPTAPSGYWQTHMPNPGLPVEIRQLCYEHAVVGEDTSALLANVAFLEWTIISVAEAPIESAYVSFWTDIDFGNPTENMPAVDTVHQLGYCWQEYPGASARSVGFVWLYGPVVPSPGSTAMDRGELRSDMRNLPLSSFWGIRDDNYGDEWWDGPAWSIVSAWNLARGLNKQGEPIVDSVTGQFTRFPFSGDPVTGTGWLCRNASGGAGFNLFSGPFTMAPRDTQWFMVALVPATAGDHLQCVTNLRQYAAALRSMSYGDLILTSTPETAPPVPSCVRLEQNYPNPFNPMTTIEYHLPEPGNVSLAVFDVLGREVAELASGPHQPGVYSAQWKATSVAGGVYYARLTVTGELGRTLYARAIKLLLVK